MSWPSEQQSTDHKRNAAKGFEVFVGGLPLNISEEKLRQVFSACGEIAEIHMIKDKNGNLKTFCFVRFVTKESAARAVKEISGTMLDGKKIGVLPSIERDTLYIGNLNKAWSANDFESLVHQVFPDIESIDLRMLKDTTPGKKHRNRGFAFVKFHSHAAAARAYRVGIQPEFCLGNLHPAVDWAEVDNGTDVNELTKIKIAFVRGLPNDAEENYLMQLFKPFGQVEKVVVSKRSGSAVGFVHFTERLNLERAVEEMNEKTVQGPNGGLMCKLQVEIARPMDKSKKRDRENSEITSNQDRCKLSKPSNHSSLFQQEMRHVDPYEEAVVALPLPVKERLARILQLGIATRSDIDVKSLRALKELPESNAVSVLDQFTLSAAALRNKGAYLDGMISRYQVSEVGSNHNSLNSLPRALQDYPLTNRTPVERIDNQGLPDYSSPNRSQVTGPHDVQIPRIQTAPEDRIFSPYDPIPGKEYSPILTSASYGGSCVSEDKDKSGVGAHQESRPQMRFDPFTGQPFKFDPFTGEPIRPVDS